MINSIATAVQTVDNSNNVLFPTDRASVHVKDGWHMI